MTKFGSSVSVCPFWQKLVGLFSSCSFPPPLPHLYRRLRWQRISLECGGLWPGSGHLDEDNSDALWQVRSRGCHQSGARGRHSCCCCFQHICTDRSCQVNSTYPLTSFLLLHLPCIGKQPSSFEKYDNFLSLIPSPSLPTILLMYFFQSLLIRQSFFCCVQKTFIDWLTDWQTVIIVLLTDRQTLLWQITRCLCVCLFLVFIITVQTA